MTAEAKALGASSVELLIEELTETCSCRQHQPIVRDRQEDAGVLARGGTPAGSFR